MKITIELKDGEEVVFNNLTDLYVAYRAVEPQELRGEFYLTPDVRSYSWGSNTRELIKELAQSLVELQDIHKNGSRS